MAYNKQMVDMLKDNVEIADIVSYFGIPVYHYGTVFRLHCPNPAHDDANPSAYYKTGWHYIQCMSCGKRYSAIDLTMFQTGKSFPEAVQMLYELEGCPSWYQDGTWKRQEKKKGFYLSKDELDLLGIRFPSAIEVPVEYSGERIYLSTDLKLGEYYGNSGDCGYLICRKVHVSADDFISQRQLAGMALEKCRVLLPSAHGADSERLRKIAKRARYMVKMAS